MPPDTLIARSLTWRYIVSLTLIAMLATSAWLSLHLVISEQQSTTVMVNVSGRQRMLSQHTALFATLLAKAPRQERAAIRTQLAKATDLMRVSHHGLTRGSAEMGLPPTMSDSVRAMYFAAPLELDQQVETYIANLQALLQLPDDQLTSDHALVQAIVSTAPIRLVQSLDQMVKQYQNEGEASVSLLHKAETLIWLITLLLLMLEAAFIFRPFANQIRINSKKLHEVTDELRSSHDELNQIAHYDPLTGVPNRRLLADRLNQGILHARRVGNSLAVCYLDLDGFKPINDQHGKAIGDLFLIEIANRLKQVLRGEDTLARLGGDEFVIILTNVAEPKEIHIVLDRVQVAVNAVAYLEGLAISASASIGVTIFPDDDADPDTLLRHADQAMYLAKDAGKNRYQLFDPEHDRQVRTHRSQLQRLRTALERNEFVMFYQPKVDLLSGEVVGAEALIRWQHPKRGIVLPGDFLPYIEGSDLEFPLGEWVVNQVMQQIQRWNAAGIRLTVSANISADHLLQATFVDFLQQTLASYPQVAPASLELEILETVALADMEQAINVLTECRRLGIRLALDDFGTGYSSLAYFRSLPVDILKVDQSFVRHMLEDPDDLGLVESVVQLGHAFNRHVIAEGVETLAHGALLLQLGCPLAQGYGVAKPMAAEHIPGWIDEWRLQQPWLGINRSSSNAAQMALQVAALSVRNWADQVETYIRNPVDDLPCALDSTRSRFGRWYRGSGAARYNEIMEFRTIEPLHETMHVIATGLVALARDGQTEIACEALPGLHAARDQLLEQIETLSRQVTEKGKLP
jgi:diguanylate cyclase (GGDEF)-like protein